MKTALFLTAAVGLFSMPFALGESLQEIDSSEARTPGVFGADDAEPETEMIPDAYLAEQEVALKVEKIEKPEGSEYHAIQLRLINPTREPVAYTGYSEGRPMTKIQYFRDGEWQTPGPRRFSGNGLRKCVVGPGLSAVITISFKAKDTPLRAGVHLSHGDDEKDMEVVWSEKITIQEPAPEAAEKP